MQEHGAHHKQLIMLVYLRAAQCSVSMVRQRNVVSQRNVRIDPPERPGWGAGGGKTWLGRYHRHPTACTRLLPNFPVGSDFYPDFFRKPRIGTLL